MWGWWRCNDSKRLSISVFPFVLIMRVRPMILDAWWWIKSRSIIDPFTGEIHSGTLGFGKPCGEEACQIGWIGPIQWRQTIRVSEIQDSQGKKRSCHIRRYLFLWSGVHEIIVIKLKAWTVRQIHLPFMNSSSRSASFGMSCHFDPKAFVGWSACFYRSLLNGLTVDASVFNDDDWSAVKWVIPTSGFRPKQLRFEELGKMEMSRWSACEMGDWHTL